MALSLAEPAEIPHLPNAAVACILQHLPLRQRLTSCALVCKAWAAVAATVPANVELGTYSSETAKQLQEWLDAHADVVVRLAHAHTYQDAHTWQLPVRKLTQLRSLNLSKVDANMTKDHQTQQQQQQQQQQQRQAVGEMSAHRQQQQRCSGSVGSPTAVLPQLQDLKLSSCLLSAELLSHLLSATSLTKLHWDSVRSSRDCSAPPVTCSAPPAVSMLWEGLQHMTKLSELRLLDVDGPGADIATFSTLCSLQKLDVVLRHRSSAAAIAAVVPTGLTSLNIAITYCMDELIGVALTEVRA
jgi:hypothetical protein